MSWLRLEDNMLDHPKWIRAIREGGEGVTTVWLRLVSWCSRNLTDGVIPGDMVAEVAQVRAGKTRSKALRALEEARLITRGDHEEITIVDYLERNPSRSQVQADRERRARAQQNRRVTGNVTGHAPTTVPSCNDVPSRPVPIPSPSHSQKSESKPVTLPPPDDPPRLPQSSRELGTFGAPALKFDWDPEWLPSREHQARGFELGLTDDDIGRRLFDCQHKTYPHGFKSEDHQFFRELGWEANDKKVRLAKEARSGTNWEKPGAHRQRGGA